VVRQDISPANAPKPDLATTSVEMDSLLVVLVVLVARNATNVVKPDILLAAALRVVVTTEAATVALEVANRLVTLAAVMDTWPVTVLKARSATTVSTDHILASLPPVASPKIHKLTFFFCISGGEVGHVSRDCPTEASGERVCYKCKQPGHVQAACPN
jgi:hypothetical protein